MLTTPFTLAVFMVRDFLRQSHGEEEVDEKQVGRLTGWLVSER